MRILTLRYDPLSCDNIFTIEPIITMTKEFASKRILELLKKQIMELPNKICIALSGGLDSKSLLYLINKFRPDIKVTCINMRFDESDIDIANPLGHKIVYIKVDNILKDLSKLVSIVDSPRWNLYHYYIFEEAKKHADICITGDGADELFAGYTFRYKKYLDEYQEFPYPYWVNRVNLYLECHERDNLGQEQYKMFHKDMNFSFHKFTAFFRSYFDNDNLDTLSQVLLADMNGKLLHDFIPTNKAFSKHLNIDIKSLFLYPELILFAGVIPSYLKYDHFKNVGKLPLRELYPDGNRVKAGFTPPIKELWKNYGLELVMNNLNKDSLIFREKIINIDWFKKQEEYPDERHITKLIQLVALEIWLNEHI